MHLLKATRISSILGRSEAGVSLIETLIALALLGLIAVAFLSGLVTVSKATILADERATAESLARSAMEYVKAAPYADSYSAPTPGGEDYSGYLPTIGVESLPDPNEPPYGLLVGIQKITVTIEHDDESVLVVEGYKVKR